MENSERLSFLEAEVERLKVELSSSQKEFQLLFGEMSSACILLRVIYNQQGEPTDNQFVKTNKAFTKLTGISEESAIGKRMLELFPHLDKSWITRFEDAIKSGQPITFTGYLENYNRNFDFSAYSPQKDFFVVTFSETSDHPKSDRQPQKTSEFYSSILETVHEGIWVSDKNDNIYFANRGIAEITGADKDQIISRNVINGFDKETTNEFLIPYKKAKQTLIPTKYEVNVKTLAGKNTVQAGWLIPLINDGKYDGMICSILDVTEQKKYREQIKESEEKLRNIVEHSSNVFYSHTPEHVLTYISPQIERILGYNPADALIRWTDLTSDNPINRIGLSICNQAIRTGQTQHPYELELVHKNGSLVRVEVRETPVVENGKTTSVVGALIDITQRTAMTQELTESKQGLKNLIERSPVPIVINNQDGTIEYVNKEFITTFGYTIDDIPTVDEWWPLAYPDENYRDEVKRNWFHDLNNQKEDSEKAITEVNICCKDGTTKFVQILWSKIGKKLVLIFNDLTQHKLLEDQILQQNEELNIAKRKAEESDHLKSAFLANMSHEIRTPMNSIIGFSSLLTDDDIDDGKRRKYITFIQNAGEHLLRIIDDIIDVAKIESNQLKLQKNWVTLKPLLESIYEYHLQSKLLEQNPGVRLKIKLKKSSQISQIYTDPVRFKQIFDNLITNAIKNTYSGSVEIGILSVTSDPDEVTFYVRDTGIGIPEKYKKSIFTRFQQVESQTLKQGTGLGLSIIKGILSLLNGSVWLESKENEGTCFYVKLPVES